MRAFQIELEFGRVGFYRGKPEYSDKNLSEQVREPITNSAHIWFKQSNVGELRLIDKSILNDFISVQKKETKLVLRFTFTSFDGNDM